MLLADYSLSARYFFLSGPVSLNSLYFYRKEMALNYLSPDISPQKVCQSQITMSFLTLCRKLGKFIQEQMRREQQGLPLAESLEKTPAGEWAVRKVLPIGVVLLCTPAPLGPQSPRQRTVILRIFFDPARFRDWTETIGPVDLFYMNPYGIELVKERETSRWGLFVDEQELYLNSSGNDIYEVAKFSIQGGPDEFEVFRVS